MKASKKESVLVFIALAVSGVFLLGRKLFDPARLLFEAVRDPNPWMVSYPWRAFTRLSIFSGEFPVWNPYSGLGEPFLANFQSAVFSVLRWPYYFLPVQVSSSPLILFQLVFAGFGAWLFAKKLKLSSAASFLCAAGFMLSGYLVQYMNNQHLVIDLLIPYGLLVAENMNEKPIFKNLAFLVLVFTLVLLGGQPGAEIFTIAFIAMYFIFKTRSWLFLCVALSVALMVSLIQILPFLEAIPQSWTYHPPGYAFQHLEIKTLAGIIAPAIFGPADSYPFPVQKTFPWIGMTIPFLALTAVFNLKASRKEAGFFSAVVVLGMGMIYGLPVFNRIARIPFLDKLTLFKYVQPMIAFSFVMLAGLSFEMIFKRGKTAKSLLPALFSLIILSGGLIYSLSAFPALAKFSVPAFLIALFLLLFCFFAVKVKSFLGWALICLALLEPMVWHRVVDKCGFYIDNEKINLRNFEKLARDNPPARFGAEPRVWIPKQMLMVPLYDAGIADALIPKRYVRLASHLNGYRDEDELLADFFAYASLRLKEEVYFQPLSRILGAEAFIRKDAPAQGGEGYWLDENKAPKKYSLTALYGDPVYVMPLKNNLPRVFFPQKLVFCRDGDESFNCLLRIENLEEQAAAVVNEIQPANLPVFVQPESKTLKLGLSRVDLSFRSNGPAFAVFSEQYYPGWRAYLDGAEIKIHPADYLLRGVFLPSGEHLVRMVYQPWGFRVGLYSTLSSLLAVVIFISGSSAGRARRAPVAKVS